MTSDAWVTQLGVGLGAEVADEVADVAGGEHRGLVAHGAGLGAKYSGAEAWARVSYGLPPTYPLPSLTSRSCYSNALV